MSGSSTPSNFGLGLPREIRDATARYDQFFGGPLKLNDAEIVAISDDVPYGSTFLLIRLHRTKQGIGNEPLDWHYGLRIKGVDDSSPIGTGNVFDGRLEFAEGGYVLQIEYLGRPEPVIVYCSELLELFLVRAEPWVSQPQGLEFLQERQMQRVDYGR